jgi:SAM-dependent methyltransferase
MNKIYCRGCDSAELQSVISLGNSPLANNLINSIFDENDMFPLELMYCDNCKNCQLSYSVPSDKMFKNYLYLSSTAKTFREHFEKAAKSYIEQFNLNENSLIVDIGSNDGIGLKPFKEVGMNVVGVEPAKNVSQIANQNGIPTICSYFNKKTALDIIELKGKADIVTASNVFAHADGLDEIANAVFTLLKDNGTFIVEVQYLLNTIKDLTFDNIYHEHVNYWSVISINNFFSKLGYTVYKVEHVDTHGGSIRVYIKNTASEIDSSVMEFIENEIKFGLTNYDTYLEFSKKIEQTKINIIGNIKKLKEKGYSIVGYGAPAKATTALNYYGITTNEIDYIIEDNSLKHNKIVPGVNIPIYSKEKLKEKLPDIILVLAWNFFEEVKKNNIDLLNSGVKFINIKELQSNTFNI